MGRKLIYSEFVSFVISSLLATSTDPDYPFSFDRHVTNDRESKVSFFPREGGSERSSWCTLDVGPGLKTFERDVQFIAAAYLAVQCTTLCGSRPMHLNYCHSFL